MKNLAIGLLLVATLSTVYYLGIEDQVNQQVQLQEDMMHHFNEWKSEYYKKYGSEEENTVRFLIFSQNAKLVIDENAKGHSWSLALNEYADLSSLEFKSLYYGYKKSSLNSKAVYLPTGDVPDSIDWRAKGVVNAVKDQGQCGSCWAFSAVAGLESVYALKTGQLVSLSEQQIVDCSKNGNEGCNGGDLPPAYEYVITKGIMKESDYPYKARDQRCKYNASKVVFKPSGFVQVPESDNDQLAAAVAQQPVPVCIEADSDVFQFYSGGVIDSDDCGTELDHCVEIVGFEDNYWLVRNSWGSDWGDEGYVRILKESGSSAGICGIALEGVYPTY